MDGSPRNGCSRDGTPGHGTAARGALPAEQPRAAVGRRRDADGRAQDAPNVVGEVAARSRPPWSDRDSLSADQHKPASSGSARRTPLRITGPAREALRTRSAVWDDVRGRPATYGRSMNALPE